MDERERKLICGELAGIFRKISVEVLRDTGRLLNWFDWVLQNDPGLFEDTEDFRIVVVALAERALHRGRNPESLFASLVGGRKWNHATPGDRADALVRLKQVDPSLTTHREGKDCERCATRGVRRPSVAVLDPDQPGAMVAVCEECFGPDAESLTMIDVDSSVTGPSRCLGADD